MLKRCQMQRLPLHFSHSDSSASVKMQDDAMRATTKPFCANSSPFAVNATPKPITIATTICNADLINSYSSNFKMLISTHYNVFNCIVFNCNGCGI